jgi:hypothetical protein
VRVKAILIGLVVVAAVVMTALAVGTPADEPQAAPGLVADLDAAIAEGRPVYVLIRSES